MRTRWISLLHFVTRPVVAVGGALVISLLAIGIAWEMSRVAPSGAIVRATDSPITEEVDIAGSVKAAEATDLSFQTSGQVVAINVDAGSRVYAGQALVVLSHASQDAALEGAQANLQVAEARLASLQAGTRPEQLAVNQSAEIQAEAAVRNAIQSAYINTDDAIHNKADQLFSNPRTANARINFTLPDVTLQNTLESERSALEPVLAAWSASLGTASFATDDPAAAAKDTEARLKAASTLLDNASRALAEVGPSGALPAATLTGYVSSINAARLNVANALTALTGSETALAAAQGALTLAKAGATANDLAAAEAQVAVAQAAVDSAKAAAAQAVLTAPITGTITVQNAHRGQTAAPGVPLVSMIGDGSFEAEAQVSEADIAKIKAGNSAQVSFDAYPGATFPATVTEVDPAATLSNGSASYRVVVTFAQDDPRISAGLTANIRIVTAAKQSALVVPASAIITAGDQHFVYVEQGGTAVKTPVELGLESATGQVEITNGIATGTEVLSYGNAK